MTAESIFKEGLQHVDVGRIHEAAACFQAAMKEDPTNIEILLNLGVVYMREQKHDQATALFKKARAMKKKKTFSKDLMSVERDIAINLGAALTVVKQFDEAQAILEEVKKSHPTSAVYRNLSALYVAKGEYDGALLCIKEGIKQTKDPELFVVLANICIKMKKYRDAYNMLVLAKRSGHPDQGKIKKKIEEVRKMVPSDFTVTVGGVDFTDR